MTSWKFDNVFYRVFCVTLLGIAFAFTLILTNVFVDIDGLLTRKHGAKKYIPGEAILDSQYQDQTKPDVEYNDDLNYLDEVEDSTRNKRSLDTKSILHHVRNPKVKKILTGRLSKLLEELDDEETNKKVNKDKNIQETMRNIDPADFELGYNEVEDKKVDKNAKPDVYHLAMHNILLQGIVGHMDLGDVYKKVHVLAKNMPYEDTQIGDKDDGKTKVNRHSTGDTLFEELANCHKLETDLDNELKIRDALEKSKINSAPKLSITATIDIMNDKVNKTNTDTQLQGLVKLTLNGKPVNVKDMNKHGGITERIDTIETATALVSQLRTDNRRVKDHKRISESFLNMMLNDYFKKMPRDDNIEIKSKRSKRHVRIRYDRIPKKIKDDDELYVEIETHFNNKGIGGEKKKRIINNLIRKIKTAINTDLVTLNRDKRHHSASKDKVQRREQNTLTDLRKPIYTDVIPTDLIEERELEPISKSIPMSSRNIDVEIADQVGDRWKKIIYGPAYLAPSKSINSAERGEVYVEYDKVSKKNGIPQRVQKPINTENSFNNYYDDYKYIVKDIEDTGFSVGLNQYVGEAPDVGSVKLFTDIGNLIRSYHQRYDIDDNDETIAAEVKNLLAPHHGQHVVLKRSLGGFNHDNPYDEELKKNSNVYPATYKDVMNKNYKPKVKRNKHSDFITLDNELFDKNLSPSEIFTLANLIYRKKRKVKVQKMKKVKGKIRVNKYLNTKTMAEKSIFLRNNNRTKRQAEGVRVIPYDDQAPAKRRQYYLVNEDVYNTENREHVETIDNAREDDNEYPSNVPVVYDDVPSTRYSDHLFDGLKRRNPLMSKYPHVFLDEASKSMEAYPDKALDRRDVDIPRHEYMATPSPIEESKEVLPEALGREANKRNYKVSVKIIPKNDTGVSSGYKEVHTSINKSFHRNGVLYSSLVNVSEISKIENLNNATATAKKDSHNYHNTAEFMKHYNQVQDTLRHSMTTVKYNNINHNAYRTVQNVHQVPIMALPTAQISENKEMIDVYVPFTQPQMLRLSKYEVGQLVANILFQQRNHSYPVPLTKYTTPYTVVPSTTTTTTTTTMYPVYQKTTRSDLTRDLLKNIDNNTEIMKSFLKKLTNKFDELISHRKIDNTDNVRTNMHKDFKLHFQQNRDGIDNNVKIDANNSIRFPFVYAYQRPNDEKDTGISNVVYHGHIHADTVHKNDYIKASIPGILLPTFKDEKIEDSSTQKYFLDGLQKDTDTDKFNTTNSFNITVHV